MNMNYSDANNYRFRRFDIEAEDIPMEAAFKTYSDERHIFEKREKDVSYYSIVKAIETGVITELDKQAVCILAKFSAGCLTTKQLRELLFMIGADFTQNMFESCVKRLHRFQLVNFSRLKSTEYVKPANFRVLTLTQYGSRLAKSLSVTHRYNGIALAAATPHEVKSRCAAAQLVVQFLKYFDAIDEYYIRPVLVVDADNSAIVRPAASFKINDEWINVEVPRRFDGYLDDLIDKLNRYELCFADKNPPTILICCEDDDMADEINGKIGLRKYNINVYYTTDLSLFGKKFLQGLYQYDINGTKRRFRLAV